MQLALKQDWLIVIASIFGFNLVWYLCVKDSPWYALALVGFAMTMLGLFYLSSVSQAQVLGRESCWVAALSLLGVLYETLLITFNITTSVDPTLVFAPIWLVCIWIAFAFTFRFGVRYLASNLKIVPVFGLGAIPTYWAGTNLSPHLSLAEPRLLGLGIIALTWAALFPLLLVIYTRYFYVD